MEDERKDQLDTEGHRGVGQARRANPDEGDTEGHLRKAPRADEEDDVEGHVGMNPRIRANPDDDDTEGHGANFKR